VTAVKYLNTAPGVSYVGSRACRACHNSIYEEYMQTDMAQSMSLPGQRPELERLSGPATIIDKKRGRYFQVLREGSDFFQSEFALDSNGRQIFRHTEKVAYALGTGENGICYLVQRGPYLFQAPIAFYTKVHDWGLAPGYESHDFGFSRPIRAACAACHSGLSQPVSNTSGLYKDPPFIELGIGCENCHGPGQLHVQARMRGDAAFGRVDLTIVNPAKIPASMTDEICMFCHEEGTARVLIGRRKFLDFRPGTSLGNTLAIFVVSPTRQPIPKLPFLDYYSEMILSKCFNSSQEKLTCLTCHDPHRQPPTSPAAVYYRSKCFSCHTDQSCGVRLQVRLRQPSPDDCVQCHMPRQPAESLVHTAVTNHRIVAYPREPYPTFPGQTVRRYSPDLVWLDPVPGNRSVPAVVLLTAYREILLETQNPIYRERYSSLLNSLAEERQTQTVVLRALAERALEEATPQGVVQAIQDLESIVRRGTAATTDYVALAQLLTHAGRISEAIATLRKAIVLDPYNPLGYEALVECYMLNGDQTDAADVARQALRLFPENPVSRRQLDAILSHQRVH
jgi:hypothetical protein